MDAKEVEQIVNRLFGKLYSYNMKLLKKSDAADGYSFNEVFDLFITSHAMSFLINLQLELPISKGTFFNIRAIFEGLALKAMYKKGDITDTNFNLLKNQKYIIEKDEYQRFEDTKIKDLFTKEMDDGFEENKKVFEELLPGKKTKEIQRIMKSDLPFLCDPKLSYRRLVELYLPKQYVEYYSYISAVIHPLTNEQYDEEFSFGLICKMLNTLQSEYEDIPDCSYTIKQHFDLCYQSFEAIQYGNSIKTITDSLLELSVWFETKFGFNYFSNSIDSLNVLLLEITVNKLNGFDEQVKCKFKPLIETIASLDHVYVSDPNLNQRYELMEKHADLCIARAGNKEIDTTKAYEIYKTIYEHGVDKECFDKVFLNTTGYTINEEGRITSLSKMVNESATRLKLENTISFEDTIRLDYVESQMLSHANGYMWFANSGAWSSNHNIIPSVLLLLSVLLLQLSDEFKELHKSQNDYWFRKTSNMMKDVNKVILKEYKTIRELEEHPKINLTKIH